MIYFYVCFLYPFNRLPIKALFFIIHVPNTFQNKLLSIEQPTTWFPEKLALTTALQF